MPYICFEKSNIYYEIHSKGKPILFLHGWNESTESFKDNLLEKLKTNYQLILLNFPGYGKSEKIILSFDNLCKIIDILLDELKIRKINLIGYCMGGIIGLDYTIKNQKRVNELILLETFIDFPFILCPLLINKINYKIFKFFLFNKIGGYFIKRFLFLKNYNYRKKFFEIIKKEDLWVSLDYIKLMWNYSKIDHYERIKGIKTNVKIISGAHTNKSFIKMIRRINENIISSKLIFLEDAGHFPIEENGDGLAKMIKKS